MMDSLYCLPMMSFFAVDRYITSAFRIGNESVPKIIINDTTKLFLNCNQHFAHFKP